MRVAPRGGLCASMIIPDPRDVPGSATMGEDVEKTQELPVNPARGGEDAGEERTMPLSVVPVRSRRRSEKIDIDID